MSKISPLRFIRETRQEIMKVTWPTRQETVLTTITVMVMSLVAALFFLAADSVMSRVIGWVLQLGI